jgi:hypothetical protein
MKTKTILLVAIVSATNALAQEAGNTALAALQAVPGEYQDSVVKLSCTAASPNPAQWHALAYDGEIGDAPRNIVISAGEVVSDSLSAKIGTMLAHQTGITLGNVMVDSPIAFEVAAAQCQAKGHEMAAADMVLTQPGEGATPVWAITCIDSSGKKIGQVSLSASDGAILSEKF